MRLFWIFIVIALQGHALDKLSTLEEDKQGVLNFVLNKLDLSETTKKNKDAIYKKISFSLKDDWYVNSMNNNTPKNTKVSAANTKFIEVSVVTNNRLHAFTFIHFKKYKQLFVITRQYVATDADTLLKKFEKLKKEKKYNKLHETDNYAYFNEKGYMSDTVIHIDGGEGLVSYVDMVTIEL